MSGALIRNHCRTLVVAVQVGWIARAGESTQTQMRQLQTDPNASIDASVARQIGQITLSGVINSLFTSERCGQQMFERRRPLFARRYTIVGAFVLLALMIALATGAYAYTASNTVGTAPPAGEGESTAVSGYTATTIVWSLDTSNPDAIHQVSFTLSTVTASSVVYAGADNGSTITWSNACTQGTISSGSATETCVFATEPTTSATTKLAISAAG